MSSSDDPVILSARRTPIGAFRGALASCSAPSLGATAVAAAVESAAIDPTTVDEVFLGEVLTAGVGQAPARQAALGAHLPASVPATTVNKVCGSGLQAVLLGAQAIRLGHARSVVAGGMESMSGAPYLLPDARRGYRLGDAEIIDSLLHDGLRNPYDDSPMGAAAELCAREFGLSREAQDAFAIESYRRSLATLEAGGFASEIVPVEFTTGRGESREVLEDESPRTVDFAKIPELRPVFDPAGSVTAANASSINDGAAACVLTSAERAAELGVEPLARIVAWAGVAKAPEWFTTAPADAIRKLLDATGLRLADIDLFELNEAFAVVNLACAQLLGLDAERVNVKGGAVALGHPIGASGCRILVTLLHAMRERDVRRGVAAICIGGGEALAVLVERGS